MKKILTLLLVLAFVTEVDAREVHGVQSYATRAYGERIYEGTAKRGKLSESLGLPNTINGKEGGFTGIGLFGENGVEYTFDQYDEDGNIIELGRVVGNPDETKPDLVLTEITWGNWTSEIVEIYAINYNGTGENKLVAHAYNRTTPHDKQIQLDEAANSKVYFIAEGSSYLTNVYFSEDFEFCDGFKLIDKSEPAPNGSYDGYDLDAIMAYTVVYSPSKIKFNFNEGEVSHIGIFYIDLTDNSIEFTKLDDEVIENITSYEFEGRRGYITGLFVKQSTYGLTWTTEELDEDLKVEVEKVIRKNDKSNYKTITWKHGLGNAELKVKKKTVHYTFN